jgi:hypothetical protein
MDLIIGLERLNVEVAATASIGVARQAELDRRSFARSALFNSFDSLAHHHWLWSTKARTAIVAASTVKFRLVLLHHFFFVSSSCDFNHVNRVFTSTCFRRIRELCEFMADTKELSVAELVGRQSGSESWRRARGELGGSPLCSRSGGGGAARSG